MGQYGVLADEYVRRLSAAQFEHAPRPDARASHQQGVAARPRRLPRLRDAARAFRQFAEVLVR